MIKTVKTHERASNDFSKFFTSSKSKDKKKVVECAVKKANEYQLEVENKHTELKKKQHNNRKTA